MERRAESQSGYESEDSSCSDTSLVGESEQLLGARQHLINHHHLAPKDR